MVTAQRASVRQANGCNSCWDGFGTLESRLAILTWYHWYFCASLSMQNDLACIPTVLVRSCGRQSMTNLAVNEAVYFALSEVVAR
eukprot:6202190-Pleurochrysis_carterae.AAC.1